MLGRQLDAAQGVAELLGRALVLEHAVARQLQPAGQPLLLGRVGLPVAGLDPVVHQVVLLLVELAVRLGGVEVERLAGPVGPRARQLGGGVGGVQLVTEQERLQLALEEVALGGRELPVLTGATLVHRPPATG